MSNTAQTKEQFVNAWRSEKNGLSSLLWSLDIGDSENSVKLVEAQRMIDEVILAAAEHCFPEGELL